MPYTKQRADWKDWPDTSTLIRAQDMDGIEGGIESAVDRLDDLRVLQVSDGADITAALIAEIADAAAAGGGRVEIPEGTYEVSAAVDVPANVTLRGAGLFATTLTLTAVAAGIRFGTETALPLQRGGESGGFLIDADDTATVPFRVRSVQRTFIGIEVRNSAGDGLLLELGQNNRFFSCNFQDSALAGIRIDWSAGGNAFFGIEVTDYGLAGVLFDQSQAPPGGALTTAEPRHNAFYAGTIERPTTNGAPCVHFKAGVSNYFVNTSLAAGSVSGATPMILAEDAAAHAAAITTRNVFTDCDIFGNVTHTTILESRNSSIITGIRGRGDWRNHLVGLTLGDTDSVEFDGAPFRNAIGTWFTNYGGGTATADTLIRSRFNAPLSILNTNQLAYLEMDEVGSTPVAPAANRGRVFLQDNGAGKTQLAIRFATGAVQVIATEP